jgi:hypothetical protein
VSATIYLEGGGDSKDLRVRCRRGFAKLLENCGFAGRMPRLVACGSRTAAYDDFKTEQKASSSEDFVAMLIDSEEPVADIEATWHHLKSRDRWPKPRGARDEQVLLMTTCMETWIVADRAALAEHYGSKLQRSALPPLGNLESRDRHSVQQKLAHATRKCSNAYQKGTRSFEILAKLIPATLEKHLRSFARARRVLQKML